MANHPWNVEMKEKYNFWQGVQNELSTDMNIQNKREKNSLIKD